MLTEKRQFQTYSGNILPLVFFQSINSFKLILSLWICPKQITQKTEFIICLSNDILRYNARHLIFIFFRKLVNGCLQYKYVFIQLRKRWKIKMWYYLHNEVKFNSYCIFKSLSDYVNTIRLSKQSKPIFVLEFTNKEIVFLITQILLHTKKHLL